MKNLLLILLIGVSNILNAQTDKNEQALAEARQLTEIVTLLQTKRDNKTLDSLYLVIKKINETSEFEIIKSNLPKLTSTLLELRSQNNNSVDANDISILSKEDQKSFYVKTDKFKGSTFITPKGEGRVHPYLAINNGRMTMRLKINYYGTSWIFWKEAIFLYNGKKHIHRDAEVSTVTSSGGVYERSDTILSPEMINVFKEIMSSEIVEMRLNGTKGVKDYELAKSIKKEFLETILLYEKLKK